MLRSQPKHNFCQSCHVEPEAARDADGRDDGVSPGDRFFPGLHHGTRLETRMTLARFQTEPEARSLAAGSPHSGGIPGCRGRHTDTPRL